MTAKDANGNTHSPADGRFTEQHKKRPVRPTEGKAPSEPPPSPEPPAQEPAVPAPMRDTELYARLEALTAALTAHKKTVQRRILDAAERDGVKSFTTPIGQVNIVRKEPVAEITDLAKLAALLPPEDVMTVPKPYALAAWKRRLTVDGDTVVDSTTGEVVDWADVSEPSEPFVTWPASSAQKAAKQDMADQLGARLAELAPHIVGEVGGRGGHA